MEFEKWWEEINKDHREAWVMSGAFALKSIAASAWDAGQNALSDSQPSNAADAKPCPVCRTDQTMKYVANYCFLCGRKMRG